MHIKPSPSRVVFNIINGILLTIVTLLGVIPFIHLLAVSLSSNSAAVAGQVSLWPVEFTWDAYIYLSQKVEFFRSLWVSVQRVFIGTILSMLLVILTAYPLSRETTVFKQRTAYVWFFVITMFFGGGLIPTYMVIRSTGLLDTIWALVIPGALNVWNMVMLLNFFRNTPKDLDEAALMDGAGHLSLLFRIYLPISLPAIATILLFTIIGHWNAWFDGILYMNSPDNYPLQTYLSTLISTSNRESISVDELASMASYGEKTLRTAQIFMGALPIMAVYPFLQQYFVKGITVGSVKG
ncbi:carbohydrate ABC transporter permease [Paenibacillus aquistagni]|uniref:Putative aldouronate transport system permease protein n=1 Tax=Paenibacillus aquistagni TaxID=1852522 RepID=A0A1X7JW65_9BACL|nr:carbohydrate ABC transporter permease [Paenibacillus aquistagni]SMG32740.1 putative aldouronate transport system permease protein [Paenibacillus aquistagni]